VEMKHGLTCARPDVQHGPISLLNLSLARDFSCGEMASANDLGILLFRLFQAGEMSFRNDESVGGRLGIDVLKSEYMGVFINLLRRDFSENDAAEEAIRIGHGSTHG